jgi:hypothetical protein
VVVVVIAFGAVERVVVPAIGIQCLIAVELERIAMKIVGAGLGDRIDDAAGTLILMLTARPHS